MIGYIFIVLSFQVGISSLEDIQMEQTATVVNNEYKSGNPLPEYAGPAATGNSLN